MIKNKINNIFKSFGYEIKKYKSFYGKHLFEFETIFNYFPKWVTKFRMDKKELGGVSDYNTIRISILNEPKLDDHINFNGKAIIEFGPLECGNTILLEEKGASKIVGIEGHLENYIRCCVIKNLYKLNKSEIIYNDVMNVSTQYGQFDISFVAGLLYHLDRPDLFLNNISQISDSLVLSTHIADEYSPSREAMEISVKSNGSSYFGKIYNEFSGPNSGLENHSFWPYKEDLLNMVKDSGFTDVQVLSENEDDNKYKLIYLVAKK